MKIVTLLSDFGLSDGYVAQMKAVILGNCPSALIVDISHDIEPQSIAMGSFVLETTAPYFPKDTIHVAVVDPRVGSSRAAIVIECQRAVLVGPDNGLMARASERLGLRSIYRIRRERFQRKPPSTTFHGRDIFAHTAGLIAAGKRPNEVGPSVSKLTKLRLSKPRLLKRKLICQVLHVDHFGNIVTSVDEGLLRRISIKYGEHAEIRSRFGRSGARRATSYFDVKPGAMALLLGSQGFLEIAVREGSAKAKLEVNPLDQLELRF